MSRGIPRLLAEVEPVSAETALRFGAEWNIFDAIEYHHTQQFLDWIAPLTRENFEGKVVFEGGCGKGRHTRLLGSWGAKDVIAIDLSDAVEVAFANTRDLVNVHIVQADLLNLPLIQEFDLAISVGVLHHLVNPEAGFLSMVETLKPGGRVATWTYGRENNTWIINFIDPIRKTVTSKLPSWILRGLSIALAMLVFVASRISRMSRGRGVPFGYGEYLSYIAKFPFHEIQHIVYDQLTPTVSHYLSRDEVNAWYMRASLDAIELNWHNRNSWRANGFKPVGLPRRSTLRSDFL